MAGAKKHTASGKERIDELEAQVKEKEEGKRRALADYDNLLRRTREERERIVKLAASDVIEKLLEPMDNLERAAEHINDQGLSMVVAQFKKVLEGEGLQEIPTLGKPFDPEMMEATDLVDGEKNIAVRIDRKGYVLHGIVVRHAKVAVGQGK